jgi:hypothetical protein
MKNTSDQGSQRLPSGKAVIAADIIFRLKLTDAVGKVEN